MGRVMGASKLLDKVSGVLRTRNYSYRTEKTYIKWIRTFILFHNKRHPIEMAEPEINRFLNYLAINRKVAASTQNQALSAILFLYKVVLRKEIGWIGNLHYAKKSRKIPVVFTRSEVTKVLEQLQGQYWIIAGIMYGAGLRLMEALRLRMKDVDFGYQQIVVRDGKGQKDRTTMLPSSVIPRIKEHIVRVKNLHQRDLQVGHGKVKLPGALSRKYPNADREMGMAVCFSSIWPILRPRRPGLS